MLRTMKTLLLAAALVATTSLSAQAFTAGAVGPVSLQNGFPVWWQDDAGVRVDLCTTLACLGTPVIPGNAMSEQVGFGPEAFWWMNLGDNGSVSLELAMEAAWVAEIPAPGEQFPFARVRLLGAVDAIGIWTVAGAGFNFTAEAVDRGNGPEFRNQGADISGAPTNDPPFSGLLPNSQITLFHGVGGNANPAAITITGPGTAQTIAPTDWVLQTGRLFDSGNNVPPVANPDVAGTTIATPVIINLAANDVDLVGPNNVHGINPRAVGLGAAEPFVFAPGDPANTATPGLTIPNVGRVAKNPDGTVTFLPLPAFTGVASFPYVIQDTGGCISGQVASPDPLAPANNICLAPTVATPNPAVAAQAFVTVEQSTAEVVFRPKFQKWDISGTSSVSTLSTTDAAGDTVLLTTLSGFQEVPPRTSPGTGNATVTLRPGGDGLTGTADDLIDFTLTYSGLTNIQQSHIHTAPVGTNGPISIFLCTNLPNAPVDGAAIPACPALGGTVTGTRTADDLQIGGTVLDFPAFISALQGGNTYVNVHTSAAPGGEIRGQLGSNVLSVHNGGTLAAPVIGTLAVPPVAGQTATWTLGGKLNGVPSSDRQITIQSSAGGAVTVPVTFK